MAPQDEESRRRNLEEALEVKSLRRIISAFLNYPEAAEEDVRRYERYFRKLPSSHKELLSHLPQKFQKLRWCIAQNSYFVFEMLKAFEPPLDLSQDFDKSGDHYMENVSAKRSPLPCQPGSKRTHRDCDKIDEFSSYKPGHGKDRPPNLEPLNEAEKIKPLNKNTGDCSISDYNGKKESAGDDGPLSSRSYQPVKHCDEHVCSTTPDWLDPSLQYRVPLVDVDKVRCIIRNIVRDWGAEGQRERDECYKPILEELKRIFPCRTNESPPSCLVPGAGLGRLALDISCLGFVSQGNEFSYYMMICSSFILNNCQVADEWTIYPWIHSNCNSISDADQLRAVSIPDIHPASAGITEGFSMCGGDFVEVYNEASQIGAWDAVVTCFFIDTAHNIVEYIETISRILKDGGVWINLGPLLYHFADTYSQEDDMSIELSLEDVKKVAYHYGFEMEKESMIETTYTTNARSMMQNRYYAAFWTMRKRPLTTRQPMPEASVPMNT